MLLLRSLVLPAATVLLFSFATLPVKTDYSGSWTLNESRSELGDFGGRFAPKKIKVEQKDDAVTITRTVPSFGGGENTTAETLTFDGKTSESTVFGGAKKKSTLKWSDDGKTVTNSYSIVFDRNGETMEITGTETWELSADGKTLTIQIRSNAPQGEIAIKTVYDKQ